MLLLAWNENFQPITLKQLSDQTIVEPFNFEILEMEAKLLFSNKQEFI